MNEFEMRDELRAKRKNINTLEDLTAYLKDIEDNYGNGYGCAPRAIAQAAVGVAWYFAGKFGITGFQAGFVMWDFIRDWSYSNNKCGMRMVDYDNMLYPQYGYKFEKTISTDTWHAIQEEAKNRLAEKCEYDVHPNVKAHWESIVAGNIPFGYTVSDER